MEATTKDIPNKLHTTQKWFAGVITTPLENGDTICPYRPDGASIAEESALYINPSPTLLPHKRIEIYNQQYWWRLLNLLHADFPLLTRLFGYDAFNKNIAVPYLSSYPPNHWSLQALGKRLPQWIEDCYNESDKQLVLDAAHLDLSFVLHFTDLQYPPADLAKIVAENPQQLLHTPFVLQPCISFFVWEYNLFSFRQELLEKSVDYWMEHPRPDLPKDKIWSFIVYRTQNNYIVCKEIAQNEAFLLQLFTSGMSVADACAYIESLDDALYEDIAEHLQEWLLKWMQHGLLAASS